MVVPFPLRLYEVDVIGFNLSIVASYEDAAYIVSAS